MSASTSRQALAPVRSTDPQDYQALPRKVAAMAKRFASGHEIAPTSTRVISFCSRCPG